jgi:hypothetical protein
MDLSPAQEIPLGSSRFGSLTGEFGEVLLPEVAGSLDWDVSGLLGAGGITVMPEPMGVALMATGLLVALGVFARRARQRKAIRR